MIKPANMMGSLRSGLLLLLISFGAAVLEAPNVYAQTRITTRAPTLSSITVLTPGPVPQNIVVAGTPAFTNLSWSVALQLRGTVFAVQRWMESDLTCCNAQVSGLSTNRWTDEGVQWPGTYVYRITAFYPNGSVGSVDARWVRPDPMNPANFRGASPGSGTVTLQWDPVANVSWYELFGPGLPYAASPNPAAAKSWQVTATSFVVRGLSPGTYTWRVGSYYSSPNAPGAVSSPAAAFPQVTVTVP